MAEEVIDRVDEMIRKNNIKYKDEMSQKAYEQALKQYEKQSKLEMTKQYAQIVKEGNRRAIEKAKELKAINKKKKKKAPEINRNKDYKLEGELKKEKEEVRQQVKPKLSENEIAMFNRTVEARAERILQEQQLQKLNKRLNEEKKRTKLYELNEKCKKMLSKSHERIIPARNISESKMAILKNMEEKAFGEIRELDNIINDLVDRANQAKRPSVKKRPTSSVPSHARNPLPVGNHSNRQAQNNEDESQQEQFRPEVEVYADSDEQEQSSGNFNNVLNLNTLIFEKSTDELLSMNYIPI